MAKVTLASIVSGYLANLKLNNNFTTISSAFDNTLSRDGTAPNSMLAQLDMGSNRIINLGAPQAAQDAVRLVDLTNYSNPSGLTWLTLPGAPDPVVRSGSTMTGPLILSADPTAALGAATKQYVDATVTTGRIRLNANLTLYVRATGSDANTGLSTGSPWATIQRAMTTINTSYDLNGYIITVDVGAGTFAGCAMGGGTPGLYNGVASIVIRGAGIGQTFITNFTLSGACFAASQGGQYMISNLTLSTASLYGIYAGTQGAIGYSGVGFAAQNNSHIYTTQGTVICMGSYTISGSAPMHIQADMNGVFLYNTLGSTPYTVTITGTPNFSLGFVFAQQGGVIIIPSSGFTFSGSATGPRYLVNTNGVVNTLFAGTTFLPGSTAGSTNTGGQFT